MVKISIFLKTLFFLAVLLNLFLASWYVINHDIEFISEIARDFFLLDELQIKKIILIGPSSTTGLFHGPLWTYVNFPAYLIGHGDPITVGWGWVVMIIIFLISGFFIAEKLFDRRTAYFFTLMSSLYLVFHARAMYNPHGAMLLIPAFFYFFMQYVKTLKVRYLVIHILIAGALIQFQMAVGVPFLILSFFYGAYIAIKSNKKWHVFAYLLIFVTLSNFIIFDLRHEFLLSKQALHFLTSATRDNPQPFAMVEQRVKLITTGIEIIRQDPGYRNFVAFIICVFFLFFQIRDGKYKKIYLSFLYFYLGFFVLSNLNAGGLLYFYLFPLFPFVFLIFSSFVTSRFSLLFIAIFFGIYFLNLQNAFNDNKIAQSSFFGRSEDSWVGLKEVSREVFKEKSKEFGYFVYSPDIIAYKAKYSMHYLSGLYPMRAFYFQKRSITYLVIAPPASNNPYMEDIWWTKNLLHINKKPDETKRFSNGYKIEKYELSDAEIKIPVEKGFDPGLHFR